MPRSLPNSRTVDRPNSTGTGAARPPSDAFAECLASVLAEEGGFVRHPADPGGATNRGVTRATLARWRGRAVTDEEVRDLGLDETAAIYRALYWDAMGCDGLPPGLDLTLFDFGVNAGCGRAVRLLQTLVDVAPDGKLGPATLAAVAGARIPELIQAYAQARLAYYRGLPGWPVFGRGWSRRVETMRQKALRRAPQAVGA